MLQKDIERFEIFGIDGKWLIKDNKQLPNLLDCYQSCARLNQQDQRIAELEEQLKNAIVPKFKIGQMVYTYNKYQDCVYILDLISVHIERYETSKFNSLVYMAKRLKDGFISGYLEEDLFATREEAEQRLNELKGE